MSEIGKLADEVRKTFPKGNTSKSSPDAPTIENGLGIEIISAKGLALPLEHREQLQSLEVSILYEKQHVRSNSIACTSSEPEINMKVEYPIMKSDIIQNDSLIMIYISIAPTRPLDQSKCGISSCSRTLISSAAIDPRLACIYGNEYMNVELMPCENDGVSTTNGAGSIYVKLVLIVDGQYTLHQGDIGDWETKYGGPERLFWSTEKIQSSMAELQDKISHSHMDNFQLARSWFSRARREFPFLEDRKIRLVAEDECGRHRFVSGFVSPDVTSPRSLDGPRFAARFVSLIPFKRDVSLSGERVSTWHSAQSTVLRLQGDVEDHALLLCSLLLGWGMDAWVCYGTIYDTAHTPETANKKTRVGSVLHFRPHYWVVTLDDLHEGRLVFWESLTGQQYNVAVDGALKICADNTVGDPNHPFREIYSMFRHDAFVLNTQRFSLLSSKAMDAKTAFAPVAASFNLNESRAWLQFPFKGDPAYLRHYGNNIVLTSDRCNNMIPGTQNCIGNQAITKDTVATLSMSTLNTSVEEEKIEQYLHSLITSWRAEHGLTTKVDETLSQILQPALAAYELDRATGVTFGNADFQAAIKNTVLKGETFKAYPTCFGHTDVISISSALKMTNVVNDIVLSRSQASASSIAPSNTRIGIRVRIFTYPEGTCACWVMIASSSST